MLDGWRNNGALFPTILGHMKISRFFLIFFCAVASSLALRSMHLVDSSLSLDEMVSLRAVQNLGLDNLFFDNHPPLYLLFLKISCSIFGYNEFSARLPSVLFSTATTAAVGWMLLSQNISRYWVFVGMLLHAAFPLSIEYAQQARPYALFEFACTVQFTFYLRFLKNQTSKKHLLIASLFSALSSYLSALLFLFEWAFIPKKNKSILTIVLVNFLLVVLIIASKDFVDWRYLNWQVVKFNLEELAFLPVDIVKAFAFNSILAGVALTSVIVVALYRCDSEKLKSISGPIIIGLSFLMALIGFSLAARRAIFLARYFIFLSPILFYFLTSILDQARTSSVKIKVLHWGCAVLILAGAGLSIKQKLPLKHSDWRGIALVASGYPSSAVITTSNLALQTPYFDAIKIPVIGIDDPAQVLQQVSKLLELYENVWIVDTYWSYIMYLPSQLPAFKTVNLKVDDFTTFEDGRDTAVAFKVSKDSKK